MLTKGAIGNLVNRYRAVLQKCNLINTFGSLAVASMLVLGGAGVAGAATTYDSSVTGQLVDAAGVGAIVIDGATPNNLRGDGDVLMKSGTIGDNLHGKYDWAPTAPITGTVVTLDGGTVKQHLYGVEVNGDTQYVAEVSGTQVTVNGGKVGSSVYGVHFKADKGATAKDNIVTINGGDVATVYGAYSYSRKGTVTATGNIVNINGGTPSKVYGAYLTGQNTDVTTPDKLTATGNVVNINTEPDATGMSVYGAYVTSELYSANFTDGGNVAVDASGNTVTLSNGLVKGIIGGYALIIKASDIGKLTAKASGNTISISGGEVLNNVYGGYADAYTDNHRTFSEKCPVEAINNTVILSGAPKLSTATIYGGFSNTPGADVRTGNTLRVESVGLTAVNVKNFENYHFVLPNTVKAGDVALTLTDANGTDLGDKAKVGVAIKAGGTPLNVGDKVTLIRNDNKLSGTDSFEEADITATQGVSLEYDLTLKADANSLYAEVAAAPAAEGDAPAPQPAVRVNPQTKSLVEGRAAGMAFVNLGGDLIAERGVSAACSAAKAGGLAPFMSAQGGKSRYETGSHVDVNGFSLMAGLALTKPTAIGDATLGAFFESGWGSYDAHNSFSNAASVDADGDNSYYGGGVLARMDFADFGPGHAYAEASLRAGWTDTDYGSSDLRDAFGNSAAYDSGAAYYGAHFGLGYEWKLNEAAALDFYTKYFWTHQEGDNVSVVGDPINFDSTDSHRLRFGARYSHEFKASSVVLTPYVGAAWEYEFDGSTSATSYGRALDEPELKGGTGMGELGVTILPSADSAFAFDLGLQGYTGMREGVTGSFMLKYKF